MASSNKMFLSIFEPNWIGDENIYFILLTVRPAKIYFKMITFTVWQVQTLPIKLAMLQTNNFYFSIKNENIISSKSDDLPFFHLCIVIECNQQLFWTVMDFCNKNYIYCIINIIPLIVYISLMKGVHVQLNWHTKPRSESHKQLWTSILRKTQPCSSSPCSAGSRLAQPSRPGQHCRVIRLLIQHQHYAYILTLISLEAKIICRMIIKDRINKITKSKIKLELENRIKYKARQILLLHIL